MNLLPSSKTGITFTNKVTDTYEKNFINFKHFYNGGGVAIGDINNDGLSDIYFTGNETPDKLYLNKGDMKFEDITSASGIDGVTGWHTGVTMVDINHDGYLDIYVCRGGFDDIRKLKTNLLWVNQQDDTFLEEGQKYKVNDPGNSIHANFFDADNDGDLDLYVANRPPKWDMDLSKYKKRISETVYEEKDHVFLMQEDGTYSVSEDAISDPYNFPLSISTGDMNEDGLQDLYVTSDYAFPDYYFTNIGNGKFQSAIKARFKHCSFFATGTDIIDLNNDGHLDLISAGQSPRNRSFDMVNLPSTFDQQTNDFLYEKMGFTHQYVHSMIQINNGNGSFSEVSHLTGLNKTSQSWSCLAADFDNDGHKDVFYTTGNKRETNHKDLYPQVANSYLAAQSKTKASRPKIENIFNILPVSHTPNLMFKNNGNLSFSKVHSTWGMEDLSASHGAAYGDLDNDGDLDLIINNLDQEAFVYENKLSNNNFLRVKLLGENKNINGLGAVVKLTLENRVITSQMSTVRGYLSSVEPIAHFGLGTVDKIKSLEVVWPGGKSIILTDVKINETITIIQSQSNKTFDYTAKFKVPLLQEDKEIIVPVWRHIENKYNDYKSQSLLPHKLSQNGPALAVADIDGDGDEDFYAGGAHGRYGVIYEQQDDGTFEYHIVPDIEKDRALEDVDAVFFDYDNDGDQDLYVVSGGSEFVSNPSGYQDRIYQNDGTGSFKSVDILPEISISGSCVRPFDIDKDGDLDLFVGGRTLPNFYPYPTNSFILVNNNGKFEDATITIAPGLNQIGMVTDATWTDIDGDDTDDLVVVGEWMPVTIFLNKSGSLVNKTKNYGLEKSNGLWNSVDAADFNNDGQKELILGNHGLNHDYSSSVNNPLHLFSHDFNGDKNYDNFIAKEINNKLFPMADRNASLIQVPSLEQRFANHALYAKADMSDLFGTELNDALHNVSYISESSILELTDSGNVFSALPLEAQFSTINDVVIKDVNADGILDIISAGNQYHMAPSTTRADASLGQLLLGTGNNSEFKYCSILESGVYLPYDVRKLAIIKGDQKSFLLAASNNNFLRIFKIKNH